MNTKNFLRLGVPLGQVTRRATDFISKFILGGGDKSRLHQEVTAIVANFYLKRSSRCGSENAIATDAAKSKVTATAVRH